MLIYILQFVFLVLWAPATSLAQFPDGTWQVLANSPDAGEGNVHSDVFFTDDDHGWVTNSTGCIYHTADGGDSWILQFDSGGDYDFRTVAFVDEHVGWAGTNTVGHLLYETRDGGKSWENITPKISGAIPGGISAFWVVDSQTVYATGSVSDGPWFLSTLDGGQSWTSKTIDTETRTATDLYFADAHQGLIVGGTRADSLGDAAVLKTDDGGHTWSELIPTFKKTGVDGEWGAQLSFPSSFLGYLSIEYVNNRKNRFSKIMKTENLGSDWTEIEVFDNIVPFGLRSIGFITDDIGWTSGSGISSVTVNGGANWESLIPYSATVSDGEMDGMVSRIFPVNSGLAFAVGRYVYKYDESISTSAERIDDDALRLAHDMGVFPNPFSGRAKLVYALDNASVVEITIYDLLGNRVATLANTSQKAGVHQVIWDGMSRFGRLVAPGLYLFSLRTEHSLTVHKGVLLGH